MCIRLCDIRTDLDRSFKLCSRFCYTSKKPNKKKAQQLDIEETLPVTDLEVTALPESACPPLQRGISSLHPVLGRYPEQPTGSKAFINNSGRTGDC